MKKTIPQKRLENLSCKLELNLYHWNTTKSIHDTTD